MVNWNVFNVVLYVKICLLLHSESSQQELHYLTRPFHNSQPGQCSPLKVQDLEPHRCSPKPPSFPLLTNRPLATREQEASGNITSHLAFEYRNKQQRLEALRSMANALSGRIEDEAKRLGVDRGSLSGPGTCGNDQWSGGGLVRPVGPDAAVTLPSYPDHGMEWQSVPSACLVTSPSVPTDFSLLPKSPHKSGGPVEAERSHNRCAGTGSDLEVKALVDDLLHSPSSQSGDFLWSDSEPSTERELVCKPNGSSKWLLDAEKGRTSYYVLESSFLWFYSPFTSHGPSGFSRYFCFTLPDDVGATCNPVALSN